MPGFVLLIRDRADGDPAIRVGYTVTKKIGGAVVRNRMKRRFRALARELLPELGLAGADHVLIGRAGGGEREFGQLRGELQKELARFTRSDSPSPRRGEDERARHAPGMAADVRGTSAPAHGEGARPSNVASDLEPPPPTLSPPGRGLERTSR